MAQSLSLRQPTLQRALEFQPDATIDPFGMVAIRSRINLWFEGDGNPAAFVVDSGASFTLIPLVDAIRWGIPVPPAIFDTSVAMRTSKGRTSLLVRPGRIRTWWSEDRLGYPFDWPVLFSVGSTADVPPILGLGGVLGTTRWTFDGVYSIDAPYGQLIMEDTR